MNNAYQSSSRYEHARMNVKFIAEICATPAIQQGKSFLKWLIPTDSSAEHVSRQTSRSMRNIFHFILLFYCISHKLVV
jgi:hypothetical protein